MSKLIIILAILIYATLYFGQIIGITSANNLVERKEIAKFPKLSFKNKNLISELNRYFQDNFGFRNVLLKQYLFIKFNLFNSQRLGNFDSAVAAGGATAWQDRNESYKNVFYTPEELLSWKNFLERERKHVESQNIPYLLVVIPDRETVDSQLLPYQTILSNFRHFQFVDYMKKNSSVEIIDPLESLRKAKDEFPLFYKSDTHWTSFGAYITYLDVVKTMSKYRNVQPYQKEDFDIQLEKYDLWLGDKGFNYPGNPARPEYGVKFTLKNSSKDKFPKLESILMYGDSYMDIQRRVCIPCLLQKFPELKDFIPLLFVKPSEDRLLDPNPEYWLPKDRIENLIPIIRQNIRDRARQDRIINYLLVQSPLPDRVGLNYFLRLNFDKVISQDIELKLDQSSIDKYKPDFVVREIIDSRIKHGFNRVNCFYQWDKSFDNYLLLHPPTGSKLSPAYFC